MPKDWWEADPVSVTLPTQMVLSHPGDLGQPCGIEKLRQIIAEIRGSLETVRGRHAASPP